MVWIRLKSGDLIISSMTIWFTALTSSVEKLNWVKSSRVAIVLVFVGYLFTLLAHFVFQFFDRLSGFASTVSWFGGRYHSSLWYIIRLDYLLLFGDKVLGLLQLVAELLLTGCGFCNLVA